MEKLARSFILVVKGHTTSMASKDEGFGDLPTCAKVFRGHTVAFDSLACPLVSTDTLRESDTSSSRITSSYRSLQKQKYARVWSSSSAS